MSVCLRKCISASAEKHSPGGSCHIGPLGGRLGPRRYLYEKNMFFMGNGPFQWRPDFAPGTERARGPKLYKKTLTGHMGRVGPNRDTGSLMRTSIPPKSF